MEIPAVTGTALGSDVSFTYNPKDDDEGTLILQWDGGEDHIHDKEVIGVIHEAQEKRKNEVQPQLILRVVTSQSSPELTKLRFAFEPLPVTNLPQNYLDKHLITRTPEHLFVPPNPNGDPNLHIIISTRSGVGEAQQYHDSVLSEALSAIDLPSSTYTLHTTSSASSITEITTSLILPRALAGIAQTIILLSGDGGVIDIVNALLSSSSPTTNQQGSAYKKPTLCLLAMGTGNALANSSALNTDTTRGLTRIFRGSPHPLPTFTARFSPGAQFLVDEGRRTEPLPSSGIIHGVVVASWALHASLVADSDTTIYRRYGAQRFQMAAKQLMAPEDGSAPHNYAGRITLIKRDQRNGGGEYEEVIPEEKTAYIVATLVSHFEAALTISPASRPLDGELRVLRFGDISGAEVMRLV
ncbi:MAG: hypothetical protein Q9220_007727, partial [cf. Caloplaca sp. 1 TL-2023]